MHKLGDRGAREPSPVREFIFKVASRCNLNCSYCYEYHHGDESWRAASKFMAPEVYEEAARKIAAHGVRHGLKEVSIALHGGEPLLLGPLRLARLAGSVRAIIAEAGLELTLTMQTNVVLMTRTLAEVIRDHNIYVGVSLDGGREANDRHRLDHRGNSSFERVIAGIELLRQCSLGQQPSGLLAVIDLRNDPIGTLDALAAFGLTNIDLLLPHHNWDRPPASHSSSDRDAYGKWLGEIWDAWLDGRHSHLRIRFLDNIVARLVGHAGLYEQMSESPATLITVNADGEIEGVDTLKSTGSGVQRTGLNVKTHSIDDVLTHPLYLMRQDWKQSLPAECQRCDIKRICTGGYLPHRFRSDTGFDNPSVYCDDIRLIVGRVERSIVQSLGKEIA